MDSQAKQAIEILKTGGIVIFPTDTAFGIGCRMDDEKAVSRLFEIRKRPHEKAVPVLASSVEMVEKYVSEIPADARGFIKKYWPGALTIVLKANTEKVPSLVRGGGETVGFRIPDNDVVRKIINEIGVPILGPSANFAGENTPFEFEELDKELVRLVDFVVFGVCTMKKPSTVIDATQKPFKVLREGAIQI